METDYNLSQHSNAAAKEVILAQLAEHSLLKALKSELPGELYYVLEYKHGPDSIEVCQVCESALMCSCFK